jgi:hypothetical protein
MPSVPLHHLQVVPRIYLQIPLTTTSHINPRSSHLLPFKLFSLSLLQIYLTSLQLLSDSQFHHLLWYISQSRSMLVTDGFCLQDDDNEDTVVIKDREVRDQRWQIMALLGERSTVRETLKGKVR